MTKKILITACILGGLGIILGAFASHGLERSLTAESISTFEVGVRYQMYHALLLLFVGLATFLSTQTRKVIWLLVLFGVILFSGSIYGLATNSLTSFDFKTIGFITPIGGFLMILAWFILLIKIIKMKLD